MPMSYCAAAAPALSSAREGRNIVPSPTPVSWEYPCRRDRRKLRPRKECCRKFFRSWFYSLKSSCFPPFLEKKALHRVDGERHCSAKGVVALNYLLEQLLCH